MVDLSKINYGIADSFTSRGDIFRYICSCWSNMPLNEVSITCFFCAHRKSCVGKDNLVYYLKKFEFR